MSNAGKPAPVEPFAPRLRPDATGGHVVDQPGRGPGSGAGAVGATRSTRREGRGSNGRAGLALVVFSVALTAAVLWALHDAFIDDAFITLGYARNLAFHGEWGLLPGVPANTATSPLNVILLAGITAIARDPLVALWVLSLANAALLAVGLLRLGERWRVGARFAWVAAPLLILNPLLASSIGLETMLAVTLMVWLLDTAVLGDGRRYGWLTGVALVLRLDLAVIAAVIWLLHPALVRPRPLAATWGTAWRALVVGLPWYLFSWFAFGSAVADTLVIKQTQGWGDFSRGLWTRYHNLYPTAVNAVLLVAGLGAVVVLATPFLARSRYRPIALSVAAAGLAGVAYFGTYAWLDVPPYFWYYGLPATGLTLACAFGIAAVATAAARGRDDAARLWCVSLATLCLAPTLATWASGLADRAPLREAPIHGNWALTSEYKQIGEDLATMVPRDAVVRSAGEFGTILYYCDCTLIDRFDLRGLVMDRLEHARDGSWLMGLNYLWLDPDDFPLPRQEYHLRYRKGEGPNDKGWQVYSPTKGPGHYRLLPGPRPADARVGLAG